MEQLLYKVEDRPPMLITTVLLSLQHLLVTPLAKRVPGGSSLVGMCSTPGIPVGACFCWYRSCRAGWVR